MSTTSKAGLNGSPDVDTAISAQRSQAHSCYSLFILFFVQDPTHSTKDAPQSRLWGVILGRCGSIPPAISTSVQLRVVRTSIEGDTRCAIGNLLDCWSISAAQSPLHGRRCLTCGEGQKGRLPLSLLCYGCDQCQTILEDTNIFNILHSIRRLQRKPLWRLYGESWISSSLPEHEFLTSLFLRMHDWYFAKYDILKKLPHR